MNRFYIIIALLSWTNSMLLAQKLKIIEPSILECQYDYMALRDTITKEAFKNDRLILCIGNNTSSFFSEHTLMLDTIAAFANSDYPLLEFAIGFLTDKDYRYEKKNSTIDYIFKNYPEGKVTLQARHGETIYNYEEPLCPQNWTIISDSTKKISSYTCQLATCSYRGRNYHAWFAPEIAISNGPWKFFGLPGLILEVYDNKKHHHYIIKDIREETSQSVIIYYFTNRYIATDRKELTKILREGMTKSIQMYKEKGKNPPVYDFIEKDY